MLHLLRDNPILLLFVVAGLGFLLGHVRVLGVSLGVAAVLFAGLGLSAIDPSLKLPELVHTLGLVLFVYTVGLGSGPGFFASLGGRGLQQNGLALFVVSMGASAAIAMGRLLHLSAAKAAGLLAGGSTNTPALAAVLDALSGRTSGAARDALMAEPVVSYSVAYPMGVLGSLLAMVLFDRMVKRRDAAPTSLLSGLGEHLENATAQVTVLVPAPIAALRAQHHVVFTRLRRGDDVRVLGDDDHLQRGDLVTLVGPHAQVEAAVAAIGEPAKEHLELDRHRVDYRRIFVSDPKTTRRPLRDLELGARFHAVVARVRRGDVELFPDDDLELELGDRVRVVAPRERMEEVAHFFGDSFRALSEFDVITFSLGIALGLLLGAIPFPLPGGGTFKLGFAGGPLLVGLVLGRVGRTGPLVWTPSFNTNLTLRQLGVVLFLAGIGTRAGGAFAESLRAGTALPLFLGGAVVTLVVASLSLVVGHFLLRIPRPVLMGILAGVQTQPAVLAFANERSENDLPNVGYATVYPVATIAKILLAQTIALMW